MKLIERLRIRVAPIVLMVTSIFCGGTAVFIGGESELGYDVTYPLLAVSFAGLASLGAVVVIKQVAPRIGWILLATGLAGTLSVLGEKVTLVLTDVDSASEAAGRTLAVAATSFGLMLLGLALLFLLFPKGKLASKRWRPVLWVIWLAGIPFIASAPFVAGYVSDPAAFLRSNWDYAKAGDPIPAGIVNLANGLTLVVVAAVVASAISLVLRLRTSSGVERQQVKWVVYAGAAAAFGWFLALVFPFPAALEVIPAGLGAMALTTGMAISLFKFRLYDIDRVVSRTVGYAVVLGFLALVYGLGAVWLPSRLAGESPLFVAGSTLIVAALFNPVRLRVVRTVDRRFYRSRYDAQNVIDGFIERVQDETDMGRLSAELVSVIAATMQPQAVGLWARDGAD